MYDEESKSRYFGTIQADQIAALAKQIEELRQRVSELEDKTRRPVEEGYLLEQFSSGIRRKTT